MANPHTVWEALAKQSLPVVPSHFFFFFSFEKHLILEEIASLSGRLQNQAAEGRHDTLELAQKVQQAQLTAIQHWLLAKYHSRR